MLGIETLRPRGSVVRAGYPRLMREAVVCEAIFVGEGSVDGGDVGFRSAHVLGEEVEGVGIGFGLQGGWAAWRWVLWPARVRPT